MPTPKIPNHCQTQPLTRPTSMDTPTAFEIRLTFAKTGVDGGVWVFRRLGDPEAYIYPASMADVFAVKKNSIVQALIRGTMPLEATTKDEQKHLINLGLVKSMQGKHKPTFMRFDLSRPLFAHFGHDLLWQGAQKEVERHMSENPLAELKEEESTGLTQAMDDVDISTKVRQALAEHLLGEVAKVELEAMKTFCCEEDNEERMRKRPLREKSWKHYRQTIMRYYGFVSRTHPRVTINLNLFSRRDFIKEYKNHLKESAALRPLKLGKLQNGASSFKCFLDAGIKALQYTYRGEKSRSYGTIPAYRYLLDMAAGAQLKINQDVGHLTKAHLVNWVEYTELLESYGKFRAKVEKRIGKTGDMTQKLAGMITDVVVLGISLLGCPGRSADSYELCVDEQTAMTTLDAHGHPMGRWLAKDSETVPGAYRVHLYTHKNSSKAFNGKIEKDLDFDLSYWIDLYFEKARPCLLGSNSCPFLFFQPRTFSAYSDSNYYQFISQRFGAMCGKRIGATLLRKIIITHFEDLCPTEQERESRAIAMGHTVKTAKQQYSMALPSSKTALATSMVRSLNKDIRDGKRKSSAGSEGEDDSTSSENEEGDPLHLKLPRILQEGEIEGYEGFYKVKEILDETEKKYYIHWEGYPKEKATWEPKRNIVDKELIAAFHKRRGAQAVAMIIDSPAAIGMTDPEAMIVDDEFIVLQSATDCS